MIPRWPAWAPLLAAVAALYALGLSNHDLWLPDEPRDAEISREMAESGDLVVPTLNAEPFLEKPPLSYAAAALALRLWSGRPQTAVRLPSALFALGAMACTLWMGWRIRDAWTGALAAAVLGTSWTFGSLGHSCQVDMGLSFGVALAMASALEALRTDRPGWWLLTAAAAGLAFLAKGPVGLVMPMAGIGSFLVATRKPSGWLKGVPWPAVLGIAAAICAAWLWPLQQRGFLDAYVAEHRRRLGVGVEHAGPAHYYLLSLWEDFAPWSLLLPLVAWRLRRGGSGALAPLGLPLAWFLSTLVLLSIPSSKRGLYLVPAFPALALVLALTLPRRLLQVASALLVLTWAGHLLVRMPGENGRRALAPHLGVEGSAPLAGYRLSEPVRGALAFSRGRTVAMLPDAAAVAAWIAAGGVVLAQEPAPPGFRQMRRLRIKHEQLVWLGGNP